MIQEWIHTMDCWKLQWKLIDKKGSRYALSGDDQTWFGKDFNQYAAKVLEQCEANREQFLEVDLSDDELDLTEGKSSKTRRKEKVVSDE